MKILAADDSLTMPELVSRTLAVSRHEVLATASGATARKAVQQSRFAPKVLVDLVNRPGAP